MNKHLDKKNDKIQRDPTSEKNVIIMKGLLRRCVNRVLIELTLSCPVECEFCCRKWQREKENFFLKEENIDEFCKYIENNPEINEVILSGGDPLTAPDLLIYSLKKLEDLKQVKVLRIHTRIPVTRPDLVTKKILDSFSKIKNKILYVSVHVNNIDELSEETIESIRKIRLTGAIMYSQSIFLKGINDSVEALKKLFTKLLEIGVKPYIIYRCLLIEGMEHLVVPFKKEVEIMTKLRSEISGLAFPFHIIGANKTGNKIPVPLDFWNFDKEKFTDFNGNVLELNETEND